MKRKVYRFVFIKVLVSVIIFAFMMSSLEAVASIDHKKPIVRVESLSKFKKLREKLKYQKGNTKIWNQWQLAKWAAIYDRPTWATRQLKELLQVSQTLIPKDQIHLALGRTLYQKGKLKKALAHYQQVSTSSDYWLEAVEEKAWTYLRAGNENKSMAELMTLLSPVFDRQISAEPYYLATLTRFRVCDYPGVFKVTDQFKKRYKKRILNLQKLAKNGSSPAAHRLIKRSLSETVSFSNSAKDASSLPHLFYNDYYLLNHIGRFRKAAKNRNFARAKYAKKEALERMQSLAKRDLKEIGGIIHKLHIVEAEVIHRVHGAKKPKGDAADIKISSKEDVLVFPHSTDEVWLDELNHFKVSTGSCPNKKGS